MKHCLAFLLLFVAVSAGAKEKKPEYVVRWQVNHYPLRYFTETAAKMNELLKESTGGRVAVQAITNTEDGWLVEVGSERPGVDCGNTQPSFLRTLPGPKPSCGPFGCGGCQESREAPALAIVLAWLGLGIVLLRRRARR